MNTQNDDRKQQQLALLWCVW